MSPDGLHNTQDIVVVQVVLCLTAQRNQINQFGIAICVDSISESALRTHHGFVVWAWKLTGPGLCSATSPARLSQQLDSQHKLLQ